MVALIFSGTALLAACGSSDDDSTPSGVDGGVDAALDSGADSTIDCSRVGCSPPPMCDTGCTATCGCCPCAEGSTMGSYVCTGGCWSAPLSDSGAD